MDVSEEESNRLLALLDDGTKASIGTMFMGREMNGFVSMDQLTEMMTELQVAFDLDNLAKVVNEDTWDRIDLDQSMLVIAYCIDSAQKQVAQQAKADSAVVVAQAAQPVVYLNTLEYLIHLTPCATKEEGVEYRWARVKLDVRPKTILMVSVAVMMVIAAIALISATIGLNERATREQAKDALDHLSVTVDVSSAVLMDEAVRSVVADALRSTSEVASAISDGLLNAHQEVVMEQLRVGLTQTKAAIVAEAGDAAQSSTDALASTIATIALMFAAEPRSSLLGFATNYLTQGKMIFVSDTSGALVLPSACSGHAPEFTLLSSPIIASGIEMACGEHLYFACQGVYHTGTRICVAETKTARHAAQRTLVDEIVTETNLLRPHASIELQAALLPESTGDPFISVGGRKKLPMLCLRSHECLHSGQEIYQWAHNSSMGGTREVTGYDTSKWLAAYDKMDVQGQEVLLGLKEDTEESKHRFVTALGAGSSRNRNATLSPILIFAIADSLERVEVLPINQTSASVAQETYLGYALNGRQGISFPNIADASSIMSGYSSALGGDLAVGLEFTATDISSSSSEFVLQTLAALNSKIPQNWEIVVAEETIKGSGTTSYVIPLKRPCPATGCLQHTAVQDALRIKASGSVDEGTDYAGDGFAGWYLYYDRASPLVVVVQYSASELDDIILRRRWIALAVGVSIIVAVQLIILLLTRRVLDRIENDYNKYKRQIEDEKHQFSELVKDVMPPYIAERIMKGTRLIAETHPQLTFFFSDIVGSTESSKTMTNKYLVRMLGYSFMLEDEIANYFGVHKIKTIGDAYFAVSGLEDNLAGGATQGKEHQVYRMASFACICQQLFGPTYTHFPEKTECFRISAGNQKMEPMKMVRMRMGIHTGPAVAGVVDVGRAPHFDCFGPSVNLASRMESTSAPGRVQISGPTYELLSKLDKEGLFEYEAPRKTLVKGFGTMVTYMVKSTTLPVPEELIERLHIQRANQRQYFAANQALAEANARDEAEAAAQAANPAQTPSAKPPALKDNVSTKSPVTTPRKGNQDSNAQHPAPALPTTSEPPRQSPQPGALEPLPSLLPNLAPFQGIGGNAPQIIPPQPSTTTTTTTPPMMQTPSPQLPMPSFQGFAMPPPPPPPDM